MWGGQAFGVPESGSRRYWEPGPAARWICGVYLTIGRPKAGHLLVEFIQLLLELLQLLSLGAHTLMVLAAGRRLAGVDFLCPGHFHRPPL